MPTLIKALNHISCIEGYLNVHIKQKPSDCILYSEDGGKFKIHKELFSQTNFLREILSSKGGVISEGIYNFVLFSIKLTKSQSLDFST